MSQAPDGQSTVGKELRLGCIVLAHRAPAHLALFLNVLHHARVRLYLHVDSRVSLDPFPTDGVSLVRRHQTRWGGPEIIDAILDGLTMALADGCDYFVLVTGHGFPLKPISEIVGLFEADPLRSYVAYWPLSGRTRTEFYAYTVRGRRELCIPRGEDTSTYGAKGLALNWALRLRSVRKGPRRFPAYLAPFGGRVWWNLSREAAEYLLRFVAAHPDYRAYHEYTWCPDEVFFCSILAQSGLNLVNDSLRYYAWGQSARSLTATIETIPVMLNSGALFAQKVDEATAARLAEILMSVPMT